MIITDYIFTAIILLISISLHEYAHARMANRLWDPTPRMQGRLTPNPLVHIDFLGFLLIFIVGFGWWKAVEYNPRYLKNPLRDELQIALAWPAMNILLTIGGMIILTTYQSVLWLGNILLLWWWDMVTHFRLQFCLMNIAFAVFNMIPIPPLDGYRLIKIWFPELFYKIESSYSQYFFIVIALLSISGVFGPLVGSVSHWIFFLLYSVLSVFL